MLYQLSYSRSEQKRLAESISNRDLSGALRHAPAAIEQQRHQASDRSEEQDQTDPPLRAKARDERRPASRNRRMRASIDRVAGVRGTDIKVVAVEYAAGNAAPRAAEVARRTDISVLTADAIRNENASARRVACVVGAEIGVVTHERRTRRAGSSGTDVPSRAGIAVITGGAIRREPATAQGIACVVGAEIGVVTHERRTRRAGSSGTDVPGRAGIAVITGGAIGRKPATAYWITRIIGTAVGVITHDRCPGADARTVTQIAGRADGPVAAGGSRRLERTDRAAAVARNGVPIVTALAGIEDGVTTIRKRCRNRPHDIDPREGEAIVGIRDGHARAGEMNAQL